MPSERIINMKDDNRYRLCNLKASRDKAGVGGRDDEGCIKGLMAVVPILIDIVPNEEDGEQGYSLYISSIDVVFSDVPKYET